MIERADLPRVIAIAESQGFRFRHSAGVDMLLYGESTSARNAIHLLFAHEKVKASQLEEHPAIRPTRTGLHGQDFLVIPVLDLVRMKLNSFRDKDCVHIRGMEAAGLITAEIESALSQEQRVRLAHIRETE